MSDDFEALAREAARKVFSCVTDDRHTLTVSKRFFMDGYKEGRADAERELREPGSCGVAGHTKADWTLEDCGDPSCPQNHFYCSRCRELAEENRIESSLNE